MHRQPDDIWRIDYQLRAGQDTETALQPENVREFVSRHLAAIGEGHLPWKTVWTSIYRAGAMTLQNYRHGIGGRSVCRQRGARHAHLRCARAQLRL
jgi:3-(3-hydroxy-phenyl)propionate hydroxylase